jgi:hypothetical protein
MYRVSFLYVYCLQGKYTHIKIEFDTRMHTLKHQNKKKKKDIFVKKF